MTLDDKVSATRKGSYINTLRGIQTAMVNFRAFGFNLEPWCDDRIVSDMKLLDGRIDEVIEAFERDVIGTAVQRAEQFAPPFDTAEPGLT